MSFLDYLLPRVANRPNCLYWVKTKGKKTKKTKKQKNKKKINKSPQMLGALF